jgi:hypothetical protein
VPTLIAVDTNVLYDLAAHEEDVADAIATIRSRANDPDFIIPLTTAQEVAHQILINGPAYDLAVLVTQEAVPVWKFRPVPAVGVPNAFAASIGDDLRRAGLIPDEEKNDALLVGESAILDARMLLTSDDHLLDMDFGRAASIVSSYGFSMPVIAEPHEIVRRFFQKR